MRLLHIQDCMLFINPHLQIQVKLLHTTCVFSLVQPAALNRLHYGVAPSD